MAALDTAELEGLRDELIRMRGRGVRSSLYEGKKIEYASDAELSAAIADLEARIKRASARTPRTVTFSASKGL